jgi:membrane-bound acyltransferase YfiQ involved in biofilm formation
MRYGVILGVDSSLIEQLSFLLPSWFFPGLAFWFSIGMVIGFHLQELKVLLSMVDRRVLLTLLAGLFLAGMLEWEFLLRLSGQDWIAPRDTLIDAFYSGVFILTYISFDDSRYPLTSEIGGLGTKSFGIYLVHAPVLEYSARMIYHFAPLLMAYQVLFLPILIALGLGIPLLLMTAVKKSPAKLSYSYLFG